MFGANMLGLLGMPETAPASVREEESRAAS